MGVPLKVYCRALVKSLKLCVREEATSVVDQCKMGMGFFGPLPQELFWKVLEYLNPETLHALSCTSVGMYAEVVYNYLGTYLSRAFTTYNAPDSGFGVPRLTPKRGVKLRGPDGASWRLWKVQWKTIDCKLPRSRNGESHPGYRFYLQTMWFIAPGRGIIARVPCIGQSRGYMYFEDPIYERDGAPESRIVATKPYWLFEAASEHGCYPWESEEKQSSALIYPQIEIGNAIAANASDVRRRYNTGNYTEEQYHEDMMRVIEPYIDSMFDWHLEKMKSSPGSSSYIDIDRTTKTATAKLPYWWSPLL